MSNKSWGSGERFEIFFRYYNTSIQGILVWKKEQVEPKLQVEATTCQVYISAGEESTEDLVVQFYRDMGVHGGGGEEHVEAVQLAACRGSELPPEPDVGQASKVARICDKSRHVPAYL